MITKVVGEVEKKYIPTILTEIAESPLPETLKRYIACRVLEEVNTSREVEFVEKILRKVLERGRIEISYQDLFEDLFNKLRLEVPEEEWRTVEDLLTALQDIVEMMNMEMFRKLGLKVRRIGWVLQVQR